MDTKSSYFPKSFLTFLGNPKSSKQRKLLGLGSCVFNDIVYFFYQNSSSTENTFNIACSDDGFNFTAFKNNVVIKKGLGKENISLCSYFQLIIINGAPHLLYRKRNKNSFDYVMASTKDFTQFKIVTALASLDELVTITSVANPNDYLWYMYHQHKQKVMVSGSEDFIHWRELGINIISGRNELFDKGDIEIEDCFTTKEGIALFYHTKNPKISTKPIKVGMALMDSQNPEKIIFQTKEPIWDSSSIKEYGNHIKHFVGMARINGKYIGYWMIEEVGIFSVLYAVDAKEETVYNKSLSLNLERSENNPLIAPKPQNPWESFCTFNPAAIYLDGKVHLLYRAQGYDWSSVTGYAVSNDGIHIDERLSEPVYYGKEWFDYSGVVKGITGGVQLDYVSGGGYGGIEDPRATVIDGRVYMLYVAFNGMDPPRCAMTSISCEDFLQRNWANWTRPVLISPPGVVDKSAVLFPEKINGKYVIMHRIYPHILIDYVDSLTDFDGETFWLKGEYKIGPRPTMWDSRKLGAGAPPLKTKYGWLLIYQSVGEQDSGRYKIGAMLLDLDDPSKVLARSNTPILEPDYSYENEGFKAGVVYPCGAVIIEDTLYVYYGGADSYVCVATANVESFLQELLHGTMVKLEKPYYHKALSL